MTTDLRKSCAFGLPRKLRSIYVFSFFSFGFEGRMWDLIVSVPDHCFSFYFTYLGCTFWFIQKFTLAFFLSSCLESKTLPGGYLFPCSSEINGLFPCLTKIKILFSMFPTA